MTRQNRVLPTGEIVATPARGLFMGNRGILHDDAGNLGAARWRHKSWVTCVLSFKDRKRPLMAPGHYTELFFHDEAVALAAGHRPCAECRRADYTAFRTAWAAAHGAEGGAKAMDATLHNSRAIARKAQQRRYQVACANLPDGTFILWNETPHLCHGGALHPFSPAGYGLAIPRPEAVVTVLTPQATVACLRAGYCPQISL